MSFPFHHLSETHIHELHDPITDQKYQIWVNQPVSLERHLKKLPIIFVINVEDSFLIIRRVQNRLKENEVRINDFILVGIANTQKQSARVKDHQVFLHNIFYFYDEKKSPKSYITDYDQAHLRRNIELLILPFVAENYHADINNKTYLGYGFGSLLGISILLSQPSLFDQYILSSPSHWLNQDIILELEHHYAETYHDLPATVMIYEMFNPSTSHDANGYNLIDALPNLATLKLRLENRNYPSLNIDREYVQDNHYFSFFSAVINHGLVWALPNQVTSFESELEKFITQPSQKEQ